MRAFAQQPKALQPGTPAKSPRPGQVPLEPHFGQGHQTDSVLRLQRTLGNQAVHRMLQRSGAGGGSVVRRDSAPPSGTGGQVTGVRISCADGKIVFDSTGGSYSYALTTCNIPLGTYTVGVKAKDSIVNFDFGEEAKKSEQFAFGFKIAPGQINPVTLFGSQAQVAVSVLERMPEAKAADPVSAPPSGLAARVAAFQKLVKNAGKVRMAENTRALDQWRQFLNQQLTPAQVQAQVHAEEARSVLDKAARAGSAETALAEQWLQTPGPNRRWVLEQQIEGQYRACTGCHATVQAEKMDQSLLQQRGKLSTPLEQIPGGPGQGPRPSFAPAEQVAATDQPGMFPKVAEAQQRINAVQPYLRMLGPAGYKVLPPETLGSTATPTALLADIGSRITQRQLDFQELSRRIDAPDFDYLKLRPIVRDLLPLADAEVRKAVQDAIDSAETWETVEKVVVGAATIGLLILAIFPPTSALGIGGALALGAAVGAHQVYRGIENYEQGSLYSLGRGAHDVLDPAQQEAADSLMAIGALNIVLGSVGVASSALGAVRLVRAAVPPGGGVAAVESIEGTAGGNLYKVTGWGTRNPKVVVTSPNGQVIREGPLSSFRPGASASGPRASSPSASPGGGYSYPTDGNAARIAQPLPEPVPVATPLPAAAPTAPIAPVTPDVRTLLATMSATSALGTVASAGGPQPVMPKGLSRSQKEVWKACNELHTQYKTTQGEYAAVAARMDPIKDALNQNRATAKDRLDFCAMLNERIKIAERLKQERRQYIEMDCDQFDWFNTGTTMAERLKKHTDEWGNVKASLANLQELLHKFCSL